MKVLVVSDERTTANSIAEVLRRNGHHVLPIYRAIEAVEHAEALVFDIAILGMSGDFLARALRELMPHCKVVRCMERCWAGLYESLDAEFAYLAMDKKRGRPVKRASQPRHTFKVEELLKQLDEIKVQIAVDAHFGSQWKVSPLP
jgi:CheY-like chemotaxis protein